MDTAGQAFASMPAAEVVAQTKSVSYSEVASVAVLTWDVLIGLSDEVELVWKKQWTAAKGLYLLARYLPWLFQLALLAINSDGTTGLRFTTDQCEKWQVFQGVSLQVIVTTVDIVLIMRVYALYNRSRSLLIFMSLAFAAEIGYLIHNLVMVTPQLTFNDDCFVTSSPPLFIVYWIVSLSFETLLFVLTLIKFFLAVKDGWGRRPVMKGFMTDGTWAYALIFVTMVINSALYKSVHTPLAGICFTWLLSVLSFAGSRLILNPRRRTLRGASMDEASDGHHGDLISIPLSPLALSPLSPASTELPTPVSPSSRKARTSISSKSGRYTERGGRRYSAWEMPPMPRPVQIRVEVQHDHDRLSFDSDAHTPIATRSDAGSAV